MKDFIVALILIIIIGFAILYIYREKKRGKKCIGCPYSGSCSSEKCSYERKDKF